MPSALGFPSSPAIGDTEVISTKTYEWDGVAWTIVSSGGGGGGGDGSLLDSLIKSWWLGA